jgi:transcriptional regulator with XRE-family HTH domain
MYFPTPQEMKKIREDRGLTQAEVAKKAGLSQSVIAKIESGATDPRISTMEKLMAVLLEAEESRATAMTAPIAPIAESPSLQKTPGMGEPGTVSRQPGGDQVFQTSPELSDTGQIVEKPVPQEATGTRAAVSRSVPDQTTSEIKPSKQIDPTVANLERSKELYRKGILTEAEFAAIQRKILSLSPQPTK